MLSFFAHSRFITGPFSVPHECSRKFKNNEEKQKKPLVRQHSSVKVVHRYRSSYNTVIFIIDVRNVEKKNFKNVTLMKTFVNVE